MVGHLIEFLVNTVATFSIITQRVGNLSNPKEYVTDHGLGYATADGQTPGPPTPTQRPLSGVPHVKAAQAATILGP